MSPTGPDGGPVIDPITWWSHNGSDTSIAVRWTANGTTSCHVLRGFGSTAPEPLLFVTDVTYDLRLPTVGTEALTGTTSTTATTAFTALERGLVANTGAVPIWLAWHSSAPTAVCDSYHFKLPPLGAAWWSVTGDTTKIAAVSDGSAFAFSVWPLLATHFADLRLPSGV